MVPLAKEFSDEDKVAFSLFFSKNELEPADYDPQLAAAGKPVYEKNCVACHGTDGRGSKGYARLAGQQPLYVETTLRNFKNKNPNRHSVQMEQVAAGLTDKEIKAVANYVATIK